MPSRISEREIRERRLKFLAILEASGLTRVEAAKLLHVSTDTVKSWVKPDTSKSSNPVPMWCIELFCYKLADRHGEYLASLTEPRPPEGE